MLTREDILRLAEVPPPVEAVDCPALGGRVCVRGLTCKEADAYQASNMRFDSKGRVVQQPNARGRLLALALCDERGKRLFTDDDAGMLGDIPAAAVQPALDRARALNGMADDAVEEAKGN